MSLLRTEQQYILNTNLQQVYDIYHILWKNILIPRKTFYATKKPLKRGERESLLREIEAGYKIMYKQKNVVVVNFKTSRSVIDKHVNPINLSSKLNTTVINYSNWEDKSISIATKGKIQLSLFMNYNGSIEVRFNHDPKFNGIIARLKNIKDDQSHKLFEIENLLGPDLEKIFNIVNIELKNIYQPNINEIQEAVTYDMFVKW